METEHFNFIESEINRLRQAIPEDSRTACAIDRNDSWEEISYYAGNEGFTEIYKIAHEAAVEWWEEE
jgi:hypothetical protein